MMLLVRASCAIGDPLVLEWNARRPRPVSCQPRATFWRERRPLARRAFAFVGASRAPSIAAPCPAG